jgi:arylsulfatase A-like enzyme
LDKRERFLPNLILDTSRIHFDFSPYGNPKLSDGPEGEYLTDRLTDEALNLIEENKDHPFFMYLSYYSVHVPIEAPADLIEKYKKKAKDLGLDKQKTFERGERFPCEHKKHNHVIRRIIQSNPEYAAMIERLDWNIGRVLDKIKEIGLENDTIIIFFSDNGGLSTAEGSPTCNYPLSEGKGWMYEGGTRVPLIIKWPGVVREGSECDIPVISTDFFPTILEMTGEKLNKVRKIDGKSFAPFLREEEISPHPIFWHYPHYSNQGGTPTSSIRLANFKLIKFYEKEEYKLFDLDKDIHEKINLCEEHPQKFSSLKKKLEHWIRKTEAELPELNPSYGKRFRDISHKIIARGYWLFTKLSPLFKKIRNNISKFDK